MLKKKPCDKCPYKLGLVHTLVNPCPQCKDNDYKTFEMIQKQLSGEDESESAKSKKE